MLNRSIWGWVNKAVDRSNGHKKWLQQKIKMEIVVTGKGDLERQHKHTCYKWLMGDMMVAWTIGITCKWFLNKSPRHQIEIKINFVLAHYVSAWVVCRWKCTRMYIEQCTMLHCTCMFRVFLRLFPLYLLLLLFCFRQRRYFLHSFSSSIFKENSIYIAIAEDVPCCCFISFIHLSFLFRSYYQQFRLLSSIAHCVTNTFFFYAVCVFFINFLCCFVEKWLTQTKNTTYVWTIKKTFAIFLSFLV